MSTNALIGAGTTGLLGLWNAGIDTLGSKVFGVNKPKAAFIYSFSGTLCSHILYRTISQIKEYRDYNWFNSPETDVVQGIARVQMFDAALNVTALTISFFAGIAAGKKVARYYGYEISNLDIGKLLVINWIVSGVFAGISVSGLVD